MDIHLQGILPHPLRETAATADSAVWGRNVTFTAGGRFLLSAPSGKGKTTLLMILYGVRRDYDGAAAFNETAVRDLAPRRWAEIRRRSISVVFQEVRLFAELTAWENILLKARLGGAASPEKIRGMAEQLGVAECLGRPCRFLSLGQQQRVAIVRALVQPFRWLFLDEPFSHLDADNTERACRLIDAECRERNAGILTVGHGGTHALKYGKERVL